MDGLGRDDAVGVHHCVGGDGLAGRGLAGAGIQHLNHRGVEPVGIAEPHSERLQGRQIAAEAQLSTLLEEIRKGQKQSDQLRDALSQNGDDDQKWKTYCAQHPELQCVSSDEPRFGVMMAHRTRAMIDTLNSIAQMDMLRLQSLHSRLNTSFEMVDNVWRKLIDGRTAVITNMR